MTTIFRDENYQPITEEQFDKLLSGGKQVYIDEPDCTDWVTLEQIRNELRSSECPLRQKHSTGDDQAEEAC